MSSGMGGKAIGVEDKELKSSSASGLSLKDPDQAYEFLRQIGAQDEDLGQIDLKMLRRKIDWRIVPMMFLCYTMVSLNYAAVMGINKDLKLKGNEFSNAATAFFIAFLIAEIPNGYILNKVPAAKWLGLNVMLWGIATGCTAAAHNYHSLLAARIFLGIFEAAIAPSLMLISSQWYTKSEQAPRFSFWYCGLGIGQIVGGIVSFGFQHVKNPSFAGWKVMFVVLGVVTVLIGIATALIIPDSPMKAKFMSNQEKAALLHHVSVNQTGIQNRNFKISHVVEVVTDVQIWLMALITILISVSSGVITTYSATLIRNFKYSAPTAALLNMPSGIISIIATLGAGYGIRYASNRWIWIVACCIPGCLGGALMSFLPSHNKAGLLAGIYLVNAVVATLIIIYQWTASNIAGHTKRVVTMALISGSFSIGNIIGPQTFQARDAPDYIPAKIAVLATQAAGALVAVVLYFYYVWANKQKDKVAAARPDEAGSTNAGVDGESDVMNWENLTDKENKTFRYVY